MNDIVIRCKDQAFEYSHESRPRTLKVNKVCSKFSIMLADGLSSRLTNV